MTGKSTIDIEDEKSLLFYLFAQKLMSKQDTLTSQLLSGGVSNKTVFVKINNIAYVMKQGLNKLRVPSDWFSNPARIQREALGMQALKKILPDHQITNLKFVDNENNILMMEAVKQPHENFKTLLLKGEDQSHLIKKMALMLATIHKSTWQKNEFKKDFGNTAFFQELRIDPYFYFCASKFPVVMSWFQKNIFDHLKIKNCLVHGDFSPKNILVHQNKLVLLDHEVIHFGDFAFDFGFVGAHLFLKSVHLKSEHFLKNLLEFSSTYFDEMQDLVTAADQTRAYHYFLACLFARVAGKSKTDYLDGALEEKLKEILIFLFKKENEIVNNNTFKILFVKALQ